MQIDPLLIEVPANTITFQGLRNPFTSNDIQNLKTPLNNTPIAEDEFDDGVVDSNWVLVQPPGGVQSIVEKRGLLSIRMTSPVGVGDMTAYMQPLPGGSTYPITIETAGRFLTEINGTLNYCMLGPLFSDGTTTGSTTMMCMGFPDSGNFSESIDQFRLHGRGGTFLSMGPEYGDLILRASKAYKGGVIIYQRIIWVGVNSFKVGYSIDGVNWRHSSSFARTLTPTHWGLGWSTWGNAIAQSRWVTYEYIRLYDTDLSLST